MTEDHVAELVREIEELRARVEKLEQENEELRTQLGFYRRRVAA